MKRKENIGGLILILIGIFWLMSNFDIITWSLFDVLFRLWPLILIVIGINIILRDKKSIRYITWGIFFIIVVVFGFYQQYKLGDDVFIDSNSNLVVENRLKIASGKLNLQLGGGSVRIDSTKDKLLIANIPDGRVRKDVKFSNDNTKANIYIKQKSDFIDFNRKKSYNYNLSLKNDLLWDIDIDMRAINGIMNFSDLRVAKLDIDTGASNLNLMFGDKEEHTKVDIDGGVSNLEITIPKNLGVRIEVDGLIKNTNIKDLGWKRIDDYYISPNYEGATKKLDIDIDTAVGKLDVKVK